VTVARSSRRGEVVAHGVRFEFDGVPALRDVDLHVRAGEFFTLLGPSGSGKSTLLRIVAGLLDPVRGSVHIDDRDVTFVPTQRRDIGFVFQNYALFPHLTVAENIEFGLKARRVEATQRRQRVDEMIALVSLHGLGHRYPGQLSGGQQQRVALGRALAQRPRVLLLDEPLGALDRRLRQELGAEVRRIQQEAETTAIYVTHDQEEAFVLSDRVGVMRGGLIHQIGTPQELYRRPLDLFVARFLGETNLFDSEVVAQDGGTTRVRIGAGVIDCQRNDALNVGDPAHCAMRPEQVRVTRSTNSEMTTGRFQPFGSAIVIESRFLGQRHRVKLTIGGQTCTADLDPSGDIPEVNETVGLSIAAGLAALVEREPASKVDPALEVQHVDAHDS